MAAAPDIPARAVAQIARELGASCGYRRTVSEGTTGPSAYELARKHNVSTPVIDEVFAMLYEGKNVAQAVRDLMSRDLKAED